MSESAQAGVEKWHGPDHQHEIRSGFPVGIPGGAGDRQGSQPTRKCGHLPLVDTEDGWFRTAGLRRPGGRHARRRITTGTSHHRTRPEPLQIRSRTFDHSARRPLRGLPHRGQRAPGIPAYIPKRIRRRLAAIAPLRVPGCVRWRGHGRSAARRLRWAGSGGGLHRQNFGSASLSPRAARWQPSSRPALCLATSSIRMAPAKRSREPAHGIHRRQSWRQAGYRGSGANSRGESCDPGAQAASGYGPVTASIRHRQARRSGSNSCFGETSLDLAFIAQELGFSSQSHFTAVFQGATGFTPGQFRQQH